MIYTFGSSVSVMQKLHTNRFLDFFFKSMILLEHKSPYSEDKTRKGDFSVLLQIKSITESSTSIIKQSRSPDQMIAVGSFLYRRDALTLLWCVEKRAAMPLLPILTHYIRE